MDQILSDDNSQPYEVSMIQACRKVFLDHVAIQASFGFEAVQKREITYSNNPQYYPIDSRFFSSIFLIAFSPQDQIQTKA